MTPSATVAEAEVELEREDYAAFQHFHYQRSPAMRGQYLKAWLALPAILLLTWALVALVSPDWKSALVTAWPLPLVAALQLSIFPWRWRKSILQSLDQVMAEGRNTGLLGPVAYRVTKEYFEFQSAFRESRIRWEAVERIVRSREHCFVYASAVSAHIIPERSFPNERAFLDFVGHIIDCYGAVKPEGTIQED